MSKLCKTKERLSTVPDSRRPNRQQNVACNPGLGSGAGGKNDIENIIEITDKI